MAYRTEQEEFWSGEFGDEYIGRNDGRDYLASNIALFSEVLRRTRGISTVIEFGSNIGMNLKAIKSLLPAAECSAVEINHKAAEILRGDAFFGGGVEVHETSILEYEPERTYDLVLIKGVLIHINPEELDCVYQKLRQAAGHYLCIAEYYNPTPVTVNYRGNENRLFKRDFAGEFLDRCPEFGLLDYGFAYHRDANFPQDDTTWFLLEKR